MKPSISFLSPIKKIFIQIFTITLILFTLATTHAQVGGTKPNIIFIVSDDLNDYLSLLAGHPQVSTPNLDALAEQGIAFTNSFCNAPICAPSRTSFLSGKDLLYTQVYENKTYIDEFRDNFTVEKGNEEVITLPEHLKNNGYYTFSINKIFHNYFTADFDEVIPDPCEKSLSWSRITRFNDFGWIDDIFVPAQEGVNAFQFGDIADEFDNDLKDSRAVDTAIQFLNDVAAGIEPPCGDAFFLAVGISKPHLDLMIPESYFPEFHLDDYYALPYNLPYNQPVNANPANGIIMPPQPEVMWGDYDSLGPVGKAMSTQDRNVHQQFINKAEDMVPPPVISDTLTEDERLFILEESIRANAVMAYIAGVQYMDAQVGRLIDALNAHPDLAENTIIIFIGDNGFSLGEKRHWRKSSLWETDIRVPLIIVDPAKPANKICNRTVSLLDLYPTICSLAEIDEPTFADGSHYLDGQNMEPLLDKVSLNWERPVLTSVKLPSALEGSCFPQYSVRNERFHYIKYATNNDGTHPLTYCDETGSNTEEELYEIGVNREVDPNEWNNLIDDPAYEPVKNYLSKFLPGGDLYLQKAYIVNLSSNVVPCFLPNTFSLKLKSKLYNSEGLLLPLDSLSAYQFKWTNNLTAAVKYGKNITFKTSTIPAAVFASTDRILFYCEVTRIASGQVVAFNTKTYYLNAANTPTVTFDLDNDIPSLSTTITGYNITGSYTNTSWNFGDGFTTEDFLPATHTYAAPGMYTVTNTVQYGNGCTLNVSHTADLLREGIIAGNISVYPNPATDFLNITYDESFTEAEIMIRNMPGEVVLHRTTNLNGDPLQIDIHKLPAGSYLLNFVTGNMSTYKLFEIVR